MLIDSTFPDHWKVRELKRISGHAEAMEWIIRLWVGCQVRKSVFFEESAQAEIAAICNSNDTPDEFVNWLLKARILDREGSSLWHTDLRSGIRNLLPTGTTAKKAVGPKPEIILG